LAAHPRYKPSAASTCARTRNETSARAECAERMRATTVTLCRPTCQSSVWARGRRPFPFGHPFVVSPSRAESMTIRTFMPRSHECSAVIAKRRMSTCMSCFWPSTYTSISACDSDGPCSHVQSAHPAVTNSSHTVHEARVRISETWTRSAVQGTAVHPCPHRSARCWRRSAWRLRAARGWIALVGSDPAEQMWAVQ
jgi:hypothetical protein